MKKVQNQDPLRAIIVAEMKTQLQIDSRLHLDRSIDTYTLQERKKNDFVFRLPVKNVNCPIGLDAISRLYLFLFHHDCDLSIVGSHF